MSNLSSKNVSKKLRIVSLLIILSLLLFGCGAANNMRLGRDSNIKGNYFLDYAITDNYLVFISSKDGCIYRSDLNGTNVVKLVNAVCNEVHCVNNEIYYYGYADQYSDSNSTSPAGFYPHGLFRLNIDGSGAAWVAGDYRGNGIFSDNGVFYMNIWDSNIYGYSLVFLDPASDHIPIVTTNENEINMPRASDDNVLVYTSVISGANSDKTRIMRVDAYGNAAVIGTGSMYNATIQNNKIYYTDITENLYSLTLDGKYRELLIDKHVYDYCIEHDYIYYIDHTSGQIAKKNINGSKTEKLVKSICSNLKVSNGTVYYMNNAEDVIYACYPNGSKEKILQADFVVSDDYTGYYVEGI